MLKSPEIGIVIIATKERDNHIQVIVVDLAGGGSDKYQFNLSLFLYVYVKVV
ncbi:MAG: hypothetical protein V7739_00785 [Motiliproteus sp.]